MALSSFLSVSQYICDVIVVLRCMNSTINTRFLSQKTITISFMADVFKTFSACLLNVCFDYSLVSAFTNGTQVLSPVTCLM
jgi:hypothetical protein